MSTQYKLPYTLRAPSEDTEDMYLAEVPVLPGLPGMGRDRRRGAVQP